MNDSNDDGFNISDASIEKALRDFQQKHGQQPAGPRPASGGEIDLTAALMSRINGMASGIAPNPVQQNIQGPGAVKLRAGHKAYVELQGTGAEFSIAVPYGETSSLVDKQMEVVGRRNVYIMENHGERIDLAKINQRNLRPMVVVKIPWVGNIIVPENAVSYSSGRTKLLVD